MISVSSFRSRIAAHVPGAVDPAIDQAVLDSAIEFCERTFIVKQLLDQFVTVDGTLNYDLDAPTQQLVASVQAAWCGVKPLIPASDDDVATPFGFTTAVSGETANKGTPRFFFETEPGVVGLMPIPDGAYTITVRAALKPTRTATQLEDVLFQRWVEPIVAGALARLFVTPQHLNPALATANQGRFNIGVAEALLEATRQSTRATLRITPVHI